MCDFSKGFILCSCIDDPIKFREQEFYRKVKGEIIKVENKTNDNVPLEYIWVLFKYKDSQRKFHLEDIISPMKI